MKIIKEPIVALIVAKDSDSLPEARENLLSKISQVNPKESLIYRGNSVPNVKHSNSTIVFTLSNALTTKEYFEHVMQECANRRHNNNHLIFTAYEDELLHLKNLMHTGSIDLKKVGFGRPTSRLEILCNYLKVIVCYSDDVEKMFRDYVDPKIEEVIAFKKEE